jgi:hypothetical protein
MSWTGSLNGRFSADLTWPSIRAKAVSRTKMSCAVFATPRVGQRRLRTKPLVSHAESTARGANRSTNHRYGLDCDHDSSMRTSSRRVGAEVENAASRFPRRASAVFCTDQSGCESAHSVFRSSFRRPRPMPGCSRCERSPDTWCWCAASRRVVPIICAPPPPWPRLSPCGGSGASTACEILHPDE